MQRLSFSTNISGRLAMRPEEPECPAAFGREIDRLCGSAGNDAEADLARAREGVPGPRLRTCAERLTGGDGG
jgi:hypothetical protein